MKKVKLKGQLKLYMQWPAVMSILLMGMNAWIFMIDNKAGWLMAAFVCLYIIVVFILYFYNKSLLLKDLVEFATKYGVVQSTMLKELGQPYAILLEDGKIIWRNDLFAELFTESYRTEDLMSKYIPELNLTVFPDDMQQSVEIEVQYGDRDYIASLKRISLAGFVEEESLIQLPKGREFFLSITLQDVTELNTYIRANENQRLVAGLLYVDNYDDVMESVEEERQSLLMVLIDRKINQSITKQDGIVRKLEKDKYFTVLKKESLHRIENEKFSLLEDVKSIKIGNGMPATLSIGLGLSNTYTQTYNYARVAIDLALARGGDQAVIKSADGIRYFGGKREQLAKNTRVKARVKAEAMREFMIAKDEIFVMGHRMGDVDSFGAAIGIFRAAAALEKKAHIVINDITTSIRPLYQNYIGNNAYPKDLFVTGEEAEHMVNDNMLLVVVDTNKPEITECAALLTKTKTIVVLDHHRQGSNIIENAVLSYIEPHASSTCEMVAEVLQYIEEEVKLPKVEASTLYAGIMIDTNNFLNRTGVRTFEAAAYLRRCGADITYVRKVFRDDMESYRAKAEIISSVMVYKGVFAIACGDTEKELESPTIIGAQAANELLNIEEIKAAFVLTTFDGKIYVSARSIDEVNVHIVMERLNGGGHMNTAGAQFLHTDMTKAMSALKKVLDEMVEEGEI